MPSSCFWVLYLFCWHHWSPFLPWYSWLPFWPEDIASASASCSELILITLVCSWLSVCAVLDCRSRQVSNWLTFPAMAVAFVHWARHVSLSSVLLLIFVSGLLYLLWQRGWLGGADFKADMAFLLFDPNLLLWANCGVIAIYFWLKAISKGTTRTMPAFGGFLLGSCCYLVVRVING